MKLTSSLSPLYNEAQQCIACVSASHSVLFRIEVLFKPGGICVIQNNNLTRVCLHD